MGSCRHKHYTTILLTFIIPKASVFLKLYYSNILEYLEHLINLQNVGLVFITHFILFFYVIIFHQGDLVALNINSFSLIGFLILSLQILGTVYGITIRDVNLRTAKRDKGDSVLFRLLFYSIGLFYITYGYNNAIFLTPFVFNLGQIVSFTNIIKFCWLYLTVMFAFVIEKISREGLRYDLVDFDIIVSFVLKELPIFMAIIRPNILCALDSHVFEEIIESASYGFATYQEWFSKDVINNKNNVTKNYDFLQIFYQISQVLFLGFIHHEEAFIKSETILEGYVLFLDLLCADLARYSVLGISRLINYVRAYLRSS